MGGFLNTLARVGLVELDGDAGAATEAQGEESPPADPQILEEMLGEDTVPVTSVVSLKAEDAAGQIASLSFEDIYKSAGVKDAPYPAEKLLKVLDGLKALDPSTRTAAVKAMDAADEDWTLEDPVLDAKRKTRALEGHKASLVSELQQAEAKAKEDIAAQEDYKSKATQAIRDEIASLEKRLEDELQQVAEAKAQIQSRVAALVAAVQGESSRVDKEITRLNELPRIFAPSNTPTQEGA